MCLACEYYIATCKEEECIAKADRFDIYTGRTGLTLWLWRGYDEPCEHIKADYPDWEEDMK